MTVLITICNINRTMLIPFSSLPEISPSRFSIENSVGMLHVPLPLWFDVASGRISVDDEFSLVGWSDKVDERLMQGSRMGWVAIMLFSKESGEVWTHYPLDTERKRDRAVFSCKRSVM